MYEQNGPPEEAAQRQDAIEINDFVYAATGARIRRLTLPDGTHWFPAGDVCRNLGYAHVGSALRNTVGMENFGHAETVLLKHSLSIPAGREWRRDMSLVNLHGLIRLVNGCTKPSAVPFKNWVADVIATIQRDGSYSLEPVPVQPVPSGGTAYVMPPEVIDVIVRLEERNLRADEALVSMQTESLGQARRTNELLTEVVRAQQSMADSLHQIARAMSSIGVPKQVAEPEVSPQQLLAAWRQRNLVVTDDVHAVAAYLAPALVRGGARYTVEVIAAQTGLPQVRVHDCLRLLLKRGCMKQRGLAGDGAPVYVLP